jgi:hypothetical protein
MNTPRHAVRIQKSIMLPMWLWDDLEVAARDDGVSIAKVIERHLSDIYAPDDDMDHA